MSGYTSFLSKMGHSCRKYFNPMQSYHGKVRHSSRGAPSGGGGKQWEIPIIIVSQYLYLGQIDDHC